MPFKHGRAGEIWLNEVDISSYFHTAEVATKVATADVTTFKTGVATPWKAYIAGLAESTLTASGFYDSSEADQVRETLQEVTANINGSGAGTPGLGQVTYFPAGAVAVGDMARLLDINSTDFKNGSPIGGAVNMSWTAVSTMPVGFGTCLAPLASYSIGAGVALGGDGIGNAGVQTTNGLLAHLHVTAMTGGDTHTFKLQDATTVNGVYSDIASGGFVNVTAVGSQRLVVPGTIRQFVRLMYTVAGHAATFGVAAART